MDGVEASIRTGHHADDIYPTGADGGRDPPQQAFLGLVDSNEWVARDDGLHFDEDDASSADDEVGLSPGNAFAASHQAVAPVPVASGNDVFTEAPKRPAVET